MTVDPGFAGEKFIDETLDKIVELRKLRDEHQYKYLIEMDGSSNKKTFSKIQKPIQIFIYWEEAGYSV